MQLLSNGTGSYSAAVLAKPVQEFVNFVYEEAYRYLLEMFDRRNNISNYSVCRADKKSSLIGMLSLSPAELDRIETSLLKIGSLLSLSKGRQTYESSSNNAERPETGASIQSIWESVTALCRPLATIAVPRTAYSLAKLQDMIKIVRELSIVNEGLGMTSHNNGGTGTGITSLRYSALGCAIENVEKDSNEWESIERWVTRQELATAIQGQNGYGSMVDGQRLPIPKLKQAFRVRRPTEDSSFEGSTLGNVKMLCHGTRKSRLLGILRRGLLLPKPGQITLFDKVT